MNEIDEIKNRIKNKRYINLTSNKEKKEKPRNSYVSNLFTRVLLSIVFVLVSVIYIKTSDKNLLMYKDHMFNDSWSFTKIGNIYNKYFGEVLPFEKIVKDAAKTVFNETLTYKEKNAYYDGVKMQVENNYLIPIIESGIIVFKGEKESYGQVVIIQGLDGYDIWYGNLSNINLNLYDYVEKGTFLGEVKDNKLYLVVQKDGQKVDYDEYSKN